MKDIQLFMGIQKSQKLAGDVCVNKMNKRAEGEGILIALIVFGVIGILVFFMFVVPTIRPWWAQQKGKSELAQAEQNRQIAILEAKAKEDSANHLAQAEINRARGVAEANRIIGESLQGNEAYIEYLWIIDVAAANVDKTVVYVPTEAQIPILEATRHNQK